MNESTIREKSKGRVFQVDREVQRPFCREAAWHLRMNTFASTQTMFQDADKNQNNLDILGHAKNFSLNLKCKNKLLSQ